MPENVLKLDGFGFGFFSNEIEFQKAVNETSLA